MKGIDRRVKGGWAAASALLITAALGAAVSPAPRAEEPAAASRAAAAIRWTDVQGRVYGADDLAKAKATVFFFSSTQCPVSNRYTPRMIALARDYTRRGVRFVLVNANAEDSAAAVARYAHNRKDPLPRR